MSFRATVTAPALVLADEPTANLDSATAAALLDVVEQLNHVISTSFIFSPHDPQIMERACCLICLRDGHGVSSRPITRVQPGNSNGSSAPAMPNTTRH
jgi:putative ABC transport system ATP-binding protein